MARDRSARSGHPVADDAQVPRGPCASPQRDAAASEEAAAHLDASSLDAPHLDAGARASDGRFRDGQSGNPRGRPRRLKTAPASVLEQVLDEELPNPLPGQSRRISMREALVRSLCARGFKDPRIALALLKLDALRSDAPDEGADLVALIAEDEAALEAYLARERRRGPAPPRGGERS